MSRFMRQPTAGNDPIPFAQEKTMATPPAEAGAPAPAPASNEHLSPALFRSRNAERRALGLLAGAALVALIWVIQPVAAGIVLGALTAFTLQPLYGRLKARIGRPNLAAALVVFAASVVSLLLVGALSSLFLSRGKVMSQEFMTQLAPGGEARKFAERFCLKLGPFQLQPDELSAKLRDAGAALESRATAIAGGIAATTYAALMAVLFAMMTIFYVLRNWDAMERLTEEMLPIRPRHTKELLVEFQRVGRTIILGTGITGLAQGLLAALGYWMTGVPEAAFFGAATAVASLIPGVGTLLIWITAGVYLIAKGHVLMGCLELAWGACIVGALCDYVIRPRLVGSGGSVPMLMTFAALLGGIAVFGLSGLILGPLIMSSAFAVLGVFARDAEERRVLGERHV